MVSQGESARPQLSTQLNDAVDASADNEDAGEDTTDKHDLLLPVLRQLLAFCTFLVQVGSFRVGSVRAFRTVVKTAAEVSAGVGVGSFWVTCALQWSFYQRFVAVALLFPAIALLCLLSVRAVFFRTNTRSFTRSLCAAPGSLDSANERKIRCFVDASIVYCLYAAFPTVTRQLFEAMHCTEIKMVKDDGNVSASYLTADFRVSCQDNATYDLVRATAIALTTAYVIAPPVALGWWTAKYRKSLTDEMSMRRFGFLYRGFRLDAYPWWGCVYLLSTVAVTAIVVFLERDLEQMVAALLVFVVLLVLQMGARPFRALVLNRLQVIAYAALVVTQFVPICISVFQTANLQNREQHLTGQTALPVSLGLIAINFAVVVCYLVAAWRVRGNTIHSARNMIKAAPACCYYSCRRAIQSAWNTIKCCCCRCCRRQSVARGSIHEDLLGEVRLLDQDLLGEQKQPASDTASL